MSSDCPRLASWAGIGLPILAWLTAQPAWCQYPNTRSPYDQGARPAFYQVDEPIDPLEPAADQVRKTMYAFGQAVPQSGPPAVVPGETQPSAATEPPLPPAGPPEDDSLHFPLGEWFQLRVPTEEIGQVRQAVPSRMDFLMIRNVNESGIFERPVLFVRASGLKLGRVDLTLIGDGGKMKTFAIRIVPSPRHIEAILRKHFPTASLEVEVAGENALLLAGSVESPEDVEQIIELTRKFVGREGVLINSVRVNGPMQVQLSALVAKVERTEARRLGFNWLSSDANNFAGSQVGNLIQPVPVDIRGLPADLPQGGATVFQRVGGTAAGALTGDPTMFFGLTRETAAFFGYIEAMKEQGVLKILANPTLVTLNGRPAEFLVGGYQPFLAAGPLGAQGTTFRKFGTRLNFLPTILSNGKIRLDLSPEVSDLGASSPAGPVIATQYVHSTVEMESGQSLVISGLLQTRETGTIRKVPLLGDIPLVGMLFRRNSLEEREQELLVVVTPRLVHPMECPPPNYPGSETVRPKDCEFYIKGQIEVDAPAACPPGGAPSLGAENAFLPPPGGAPAAGPSPEPVPSPAPQLPNR